MLVGSRRQSLFKLLMIVLTLATLEAGVRVFDFLRGASAHGRCHWYWGFEQDRYLGYRPRPNTRIQFSNRNWFDTNSDGFRDAETPIEAGPARRMLIAMGESTTWGTGCSDQSTTWPNGLERRLHFDDRGNEHVAETLEPQVLEALGTRSLSAPSAPRAPGIE